MRQRVPSASKVEAVPASGLLTVPRGAVPSHTAPRQMPGSGPAVGWDLTRIPGAARTPLAAQPRLSVSAPNDPLEREADAAADRVVSGFGAATAVSRDAVGGGAPQAKTDSSPGREEQREESDEPILVDLRGENEEPEETPPIQAKADPAAQPVRASHPPAGFGGPGGVPLPTPLRGRMEQGFAADFSNVRLHTGPEAEAVCKTYGARALTSANHIHMAAGEYRPESTEGQRLIAHELAHTVQQGAVPAAWDTPVSSAGASPDDVQRTIDLSIQFDTYSLSALNNAVPYSGGDVGAVLREMETTALGHFSARNPVTSMQVSDTWYYYNPLFTRSIYATRSWTLSHTASNYLWWATDTHDFSFRYAHTATRQRTGTFASANGTSRSQTTTLSVGAKLSYSIVELSASASTATTTGRTSSTTATSTNYYEHDYDVSLNYNSSYYEQSDFRLRNTFFGPVIDRVGGPHTLSGTVQIGSCSVKDDENNPDNLSP